jgi:hypothetical protein
MSVPAWFAGFQAFDNRLLFPGDVLVNGGEPSCCISVQQRHRGTSFRLARLVRSDTHRETKKPPSRSRDERCHARGTTPLCHSLSVCDLYLCGSVVLRMLRHSGSGNGEPHPSPPTGDRKDPVRDEARRAFSPVFPVPLLSFRGSLFRFDRLLVLVNACRVRMSASTLADAGAAVNGRPRDDSG